MIPVMSTISEIEKAIERLPEPQVAELAAWLEQLRTRRAAQTPCDTWLESARGAARPGVTTQDVLSLTRGEE
jgi:hypothetical protein